MDEAHVIIRPFDPDFDQALVYATWRNGLYYAKPRQTREDDANEEFKQLTTHIRNILKSAKVIIGCLDDTPNFIVGYAVFSKKNLDWVYVKEDYRKKGVATLITGSQDYETMTEPVTKIGLSIVESWKKKHQGE